jgi:hypothetical protein
LQSADRFQGLSRGTGPSWTNLAAGERQRRCCSGTTIGEPWARPAAAVSSDSPHRPQPPAVHTRTCVSVCARKAGAAARGGQRRLDGGDGRGARGGCGAARELARRGSGPHVWRCAGPHPTAASRVALSSPLTGAPRPGCADSRSNRQGRRGRARGRQMRRLLCGTITDGGGLRCEDASPPKWQACNLHYSIDGLYSTFMYICIFL